MTYYIFPKDQKLPDQNRITSINILGESDLGRFWPEQGFDVFKRIVNDGIQEVLESIRIINSNGKEISVDDFLYIIEGMKIK